MSKGEIVLYAAEDGRFQVHLHAVGGTVWLTQAEIASLFQTSPQNIAHHARAIYREGEVTEEATCKSYLQVQKEGTREVERQVKIHNLEFILAVGYRLRSARGVAFRQWATAQLKEYLIKGFVMDDARLKDPSASDFFEEMRQRIREIRASEKRFHQKVRELFALSVDYRDDGAAVALFFIEVQNKMLFAVTGKTAAEIVIQRADATQPHMALKNWKAGRVRKTDVLMASNYLDADEVNQLNRIVVGFLEFAELRALHREALHMADWRQHVDNFVTFMERPLLQGTGVVSQEHMEQVANERYSDFDARRRQAEALSADASDLLALRQAELLLGRKEGSHAP